MTKGLPFADNFTDLMICDLNLHYFTEKTTFEILQEIKRVLKPGGILLFRVNSTKDVNHGAGEGKKLNLIYMKQMTEDIKDFLIKKIQTDSLQNGKHFMYMKKKWEDMKKKKSCGDVQCK